MNRLMLPLRRGAFTSRWAQQARSDGYNSRFSRISPLYQPCNQSVILRSFLATQSGGSNKPDGEKGTLARRAAGVTGAAAVLFGKGKYILAALKFTKFTSVFSMLASTGAYALFFGWPFAVGMVGQILLHESGHALAMRALNIPFGAAVFIPFMGAVIPMRGRPKDVKEEAIVAIAGPVFGGATAIALSVAGISSGNQFLLTLADFGLMINLFNMLPIGDLDGGRISKAISKYLLLAGLGGGVYMAYEGIIGNPIFYLVLLSGVFTTFSRFFGSATEPHPSYYRINGGSRAMWALGYFGLIGLLATAMSINRHYMKPVRKLREESGDFSAGGAYEQQLEQFARDMGEDDPFLSGKGFESNQTNDFFDDDFLREHFQERKR